MKALAWYSVIFNVLIIIFFLLSTIGVVPPPPFSAFENIAWMVLTLPVVALGLLIIRRFE